MDQDLFRLILLVFGVVLVATVYYWERLRDRFLRRPGRSGARRQSPPRFGDLDEPADAETTPARGDAVDEAAEDVPDLLASELEALIRAEESVDVLLDAPSTAPEVPAGPGAGGGDAPATQETPAPETPPRKSPAEAAPQEKAPPVLAVTLVASGGEISGIRLRRVLTDHGLGLGSRGLFERIGEEGRALYSAANLVEPGTFDPLTLDGTSTPGLLLFQVVSGSGDHVAIFDAMLETAGRLADRLDCTLCDARRKPLGQAAIAAMREKAAHAGA
ncbi:MAG: cell division protein ZipA C-terminal FtsZ-binding domain-containing protein [Gammaproteobacteria bacterium]|nr:cell division protein ZipA C-terminal FtsZ-binding domain-containing protein [Gammaproteobacteria bacterium]